MTRKIWNTKWEDYKLTATMPAWELDCCVPQLERAGIAYEFRGSEKRSAIFIKAKYPGGILIPKKEGRL